MFPSCFRWRSEFKVKAPTYAPSTETAEDGYQFYPEPVQYNSGLYRKSEPVLNKLYIFLVDK